MLFLKERSPSGKPYYSLPGGRLEEEESDEEGLTREVSEETGLEITVGPFLGEYSFTMENGNKVDLRVFECFSDTRNVDVRSNAMHDERIESFEWIFPQDFLDRKLHAVDSSFIRLLERIISIKTREK